MFTLYQSVDWRRCLCACGGLDSSAWTVPPPPVCLLHNMIYDSTILLFLYYYIREDVGSRFPYTLTKPSQRVRVTWIDHRAGIPSGVDVIGISPFYGSCLLPFALVATADSRLRVSTTIEALRRGPRPRPTLLTIDQTRWTISHSYSAACAKSISQLVVHGMETPQW